MHGSTGTPGSSDSSRIGLLVVGSTEWHGRHLPVETDTLIAQAYAEALAAAYADVTIGPTIPISCSHEHAGSPGTRSITAPRLHRLTRQHLRQMRLDGCTAVLIVSGHGGNYVLNNVAQEVNVGRPWVGIFPGPQAWKRAEQHAGLVTTAHEDMHAGERETSIMLYRHPELVGAVTSADDHLADDRPYLHLLGMKGYTETGVIGRPSLATSEKGRLILDSMTASAEGILTELRRSAAPAPRPPARPELRERPRSASPGSPARG